ncbi:MAG: twin-arginine translocase TatA/TatE family subunit [Acidimicrobiia bacterium]
MGSLGAPELLIILAIVLLLFGSTRLPKMARSLGQASKEFKKGIDHGASEDDDAPTDTKTPPKAAAAADPAPPQPAAEKPAAVEAEASTEKAADEAKT